MLFVTIKKSAEFKRIFEAGKEVSAVNSFTGVYMIKNGLAFHRFGIVVSKKIGKAVVRNKVRRRIREILKALLKDRLSGQEMCFDIVVAARKSAANTEFALLNEGIQRLVGKLLKRGAH